MIEEKDIKESKEEKEYEEKCEKLLKKFQDIELEFLHDESNDPFILFDVIERLYFDELASTSDVDRQNVKEDSEDPVILDKYKFAELLVNLIQFFTLAMPDLIGILDVVKQDVFFKYKHALEKEKSSNMLKNFGFERFN